MLKIEFFLSFFLLSITVQFAQGGLNDQYNNPPGSFENEDKETSKSDTDLIESLASYNFFSEAIARNVQLYTVNSQVAYEKNDLERANFLYDSLVNHCLKGTRFDNFLVNSAKTGSSKYFEEYARPVYLKTISNWCEPNDSEAAAFNDVANEFGDLIDFVVLYWDSQETAAQKVNDYSSKVSVVYVDEQDNFSSEMISRIKHSLGLPTVFLLDESQKVLSVKRGTAPVYTQDASKDKEIIRFKEFYTKASKEHFAKSYKEYFNDMIKDVNFIITKM